MGRNEEILKIDKIQIDVSFFKEELSVITLILAKLYPFIKNEQNTHGCINSTNIQLFNKITSACFFREGPKDKYYDNSDYDPSELLSRYNESLNLYNDFNEFIKIFSKNFNDGNPLEFEIINTNAITNESYLFKIKNECCKCLNNEYCSCVLVD